MALDRWDPVRDLLHLREKVDGLFQDVLGRAGSELGPGASGAFRPPVDVWEEGERYQLRVDLPGVASGDVRVEIEEGVLHVRGERRAQAPVPGDAMLRSERPQGRFALSMALPPTVDPGGISARHRDGVLEIALTKRREDRGGRLRIDLK